MHSFQVIVIGAGIAGLSTAVGLSRKGDKVTVLERSSRLRNIGGGVQLRPNAARVYVKYGLKDIDAKQDHEGDGYLIKRYQNAAVLAELKIQDDAEIYGAPRDLFPERG